MFISLVNMNKRAVILHIYNKNRRQMKVLCTFN